MLGDKSTHLRVPQQYNLGLRAGLDVGRQLVHGSAHPLPRTRDVVKCGWVNDVLVIRVVVVRNDQICERSHVTRVLFRRASGDQDVNGSAGRLAPSESGILDGNGRERVAQWQQERSREDLAEHLGNRSSFSQVLQGYNNIERLLRASNERYRLSPQPHGSEDM